MFGCVSFFFYGKYFKFIDTLPADKTVVKAAALLDVCLTSISYYFFLVILDCSSQKFCCFLNFIFVVFLTIFALSLSLDFYYWHFCFFFLSPLSFGIMFLLIFHAETTKLPICIYK